MARPLNAPPTRNIPFWADLHCHSTASDGADRPARVVERAKAAGLHVLALTDHDTIDGVPEAREAGDRLGVQVITGCELTCYRNGKEVNILGYGVNANSETLKKHCGEFVEARVRRAHEIGRKLDALGVGVDMDALVANADGGVIGRPHVAKALVAAGHVQNMQEAFDRFLQNGGPADVPKMVVSDEFAIKVIHEAGGIAVLAHPGIWDQYDWVAPMVELGLDGVEVWHSGHAPADSLRLAAIADELGILKTGGSDCHGKLGERQELLGKWGLDRADWEKVERRLEA